MASLMAKFHNDDRNTLATNADLWVAFGKLVNDNDAWFSQVAPLAKSDAPITKGDLDAYLAELHTAWTNRFAGPHVEQVAAQTIAFDMNLACAKASFNLPKNFIAIPIHWRIKNTSATPVRIEGVICNGEGWHTTNSIRDLIEEGASKSDMERAFMAYFFMRRHHTHGPAAKENWDDDAFLDPVVFHAAYGYGLCGHIAHAFLGLCKTLGLKARIRAVNGHTFPEVWCDEKWNILDPNGETWFPDPQAPERLLSLEELSVQGDVYWKSVHFRPIDRGKPRMKFFEKFRAPNSHKVLVDTDSLLDRPEKQLCAHLIPGESMTLYHNTQSGWHASMQDRLWAAPFVPPLNVCLMRTDIQFHGDQLPSQTGETLVHELQESWPLLDVTVSIVGADCEGVGVFLTVGEKRIGPFAPLANQTERRVFSLRRGVLDLWGETTVPSVVIEGLGEHKVEAVEIAAHYQYSQHAFPRPLPGSNAIEVLFEGDCVRVELGLEEDTASPIVTSMQTTPDSAGGLTFSWVGAAMGVEEMPHPVTPRALTRPGPKIGYEFLVTHSKRDFDAVAPHLHRYVAGPHFHAAPSDLTFLQDGRTYQWRVRLVDANKNPFGHWSEFLPFMRPISLAENHDE